MEIRTARRLMATTTYYDNMRLRLVSLGYALALIDSHYEQFRDRYIIAVSQVYASLRKFSWCA